MSKQSNIGKEEIERAKQMRDQSTSITQYRKALSVILMSQLGLTADLVSELLGVSRRTVFRSLGDIRSQDVTDKKLWGGRRHCSMTVEEEREFLDPWENLATAGGILTVPPIHAALVERAWAMLCLCQPHIGYWRVMVGEKSNPTQNTPKAIRHCRTNLKKILRRSGCRQHEK